MKLSGEHPTAQQLVIGGWVPFTTVDFPGKLACVVFLQGCPWRCPYCHNPHLRKRVPPAAANSGRWTAIIQHLTKRSGVLDGVVFSGGEPLLQPALLAAVHEIRKMGFLTGLHTAGIYPERLRRTLPHLDWVGLDMKAPPDERYDKITGRKGSARLFRRSLEVLIESQVPFQIRTTVDPALLSRTDIMDLQDWLKNQNLAQSILQQYRQLS